MQGIFKNLLKDALKAIRLVLILWIITAVIYPLFILFVGQNFFPFQANGSMQSYLEGNEPIGSTLIGQRFFSDEYFQSRPSQVKYSLGKKAKPNGISGASNFAPENSALIERVKQETAFLADESIPPLADLIYSSASGLDPHISLEAAEKQVQRVSRARGLQQDEEQDLYKLIRQHTDNRFISIFGEPGVNLLKLNYKLDIKEFTRPGN
ncbi:MAG: K(+)-transporting ATPase subunit C [Cyanobacteria bacterium P01_A01_bin.45]